MPYYKHGESSGGIWTVEYISWMRMRQRCLDPNTGYYHLWGGRGIAFGPAWDDYKVFLRDMGRRPSKAHTLERIDNSKGYSKSNCRWATMKEQSHNRRNTVLDQTMVNDIRQLYSKGTSQSTIAWAYSISQQHVSRIVRRERWT